MSLQPLQYESASPVMYWMQLSNSTSTGVQIFRNDRLSTANSLSSEDYNEDMVKKILAAKNAYPVATFTSKEELNAWLENLQRK